jgi:hypothetical protein
MIPAALEGNKFIYNICGSSELSKKSPVLMAFFVHKKKQTSKLGHKMSEAMEVGRWMDRKEAHSIRQEAPWSGLGVLTFYISQILSSRWGRSSC